jgi:hypothetical protein
LHLPSTDLFNRRVSLQHDLTARDRAIAQWVEAAAGKKVVPCDRAYDADIAFGHCLIGMDDCRMHMDWYINTLPFTPIPERYNEDINLMLGLLESCKRTTIQADSELNRIETVIEKHLHPQPEESRSRLSRFLSRFGSRKPQYRFPFLPLRFKTTNGQNLPDILVNHYYVREALTGFSGQVMFWYAEQETSKMPVAFGTPGQRLAIIMPAVFS